jgi:arylsulfatase A-like enzyme
MKKMSRLNKLLSSCILLCSTSISVQAQPLIMSAELNAELSEAIDTQKTSSVKKNQSSDKQLNFVYLIIDDLRTELNTYGLEDMKTPHIDQLASEGVLFEKAFSNVATCGASRSSIMTGLYPTQTRFTHWYSRMDEHAPGIITLAEQLKNNGYHTQSLGKVNHTLEDTQQMWSVEPWVAEAIQTKDYQKPENIKLLKKTGKGPAWEIHDVDDFTHKDGRVTLKALNTLEKLAEKKQPFFLAIGLQKPHLPFVVPKKYFDMYPIDSISLPNVSSFPKSAPIQAWHGSGELRNYSGMGKMPKNEASDSLTLSTKIALIRGYKASTSYVDTLVGIINDKIKALNLDDNTVVILTGDHGFSLGEHSIWNKHSTFNIAAQSPLLIKAPGIEGNKRVKGVVEFVDIYPTVVSLANIDAPKHLQGTDLTPALTDENFTKGAIFHRHRFNEGEAIRTARYSYSLYFDNKGHETAQMLYDHKNDPDEAVNVAEQEAYKTVVASLKKRLLAHMQSR